jgi:uncharacterized protein YegL
MPIMLNMDKLDAINLVKLNLNKNPHIKRRSADVALYLDTSGSMQALSHLIDPIMKLMIVFADTLDSNGSLRYYHFSSDIEPQPNLSLADYDNYHSIWPGGGTATDLCIRNEIPSKLKNIFGNVFGKKPEKKVVFIITDGRPDYEYKVVQAIADAAQHDIFFQFVCLGDILLLENENSPMVDTKKFTNLDEMTNESFAATIISNDLANFLK